MQLTIALPSLLAGFQSGMELIQQLGPATQEWMVVPSVLPQLARRHIRRIGVTDAADGLAFIRPQPDFSRVLACFSGEGEVLVDGEWRRCPPGWAYLTSADQPHGHRALPTGRWGICWLVYDRGPGCPLPLLGAPRLVRCDAEPLRLAIMGLYREVTGEGQGALGDGWLDLIEAYGRTIAHRLPSDERLERLWAEVAADLRCDWTLAALAELAQISVEHLRRLCARQVGCTPMERVTAIRMRYAAALLRAGEPVDEVADAVGYGDRSSFSVAFKRATGKTPAALRALR